MAVFLVPLHAGFLAGLSGRVAVADEASLLRDIRKGAVPVVASTELTAKAIIL